jgi:broad specificity phosphatase PhoE
MTITLIRHLKVNFPWKLFYTAAGFARACRGYNEAPVFRPRRSLNGDRPIATSTLRRAIDTARLLFGREPDRTTDLIAEVPMNPFLNTSWYLPRVAWELLGRFQWILGLKTQPETYTATARRVKVFSDELLAAGNDCIVVSHGWVLMVMIRRLTALGFRGPRPAYLRNGVPFSYRR